MRFKYSYCLQWLRMFVAVITKAPAGIASGGFSACVISLARNLSFPCTWPLRYLNVLIIQMAGLS